MTAMSGDTASELASNSGSGKDVLFRDSKFGVLAAGAVTIVVDAVVDGALEALTNVDTSGWTGWWTTVASALLATAVGLVTAYKAKRRKTLR